MSKTPDPSDRASRCDCGGSEIALTEDSSGYLIACPHCGAEESGGALRECVELWNESVEERKGNGDA